MMVKPVLEALIGLKVGSWLLSAGGLLFKVAAGLDAVTNAIPGFVAAMEPWSRNGSSP